MRIISFTNSDRLPSVAGVERNRCGIWLSNLEKNCPSRVFAQGFEERRSDPAAA